MWPTSTQWDEALKVSHSLTTYAEVWRRGVYTGTRLALLDGTVRGDEGSKVRRTLSASTDRVDLAPADADDFLTPVDTDLKVYSGFAYTDGSTEVVPVGVFRLESPGRASRFDALSLSGADYASVLQRARFLKPYNVAKNLHVVDVIETLAHEVLPWVDVLDLTGSNTKTTALVFDRERWDAMENLATSIGAEVAFNPEGNLVIRDVPTVADPVVFDIDTDVRTSILLDASVGLDLTGVYNAVVASSSDTDVPPVTYTLKQASGPLRWRTGFEYPRFYSSPLLKTKTQCYTAAKGILARSLAYTQTLDPTIVPNPALDIGDVITVGLPGEEHVTRVVTTFDLPLGPGAMNVAVRVSADVELAEGESLE